MATEVVSGTVYDDSNKAVSGAAVTCKNLNTETVVATTTSNSSGKFSFTVTVGGDYLFTATKDGETLATSLDNEGGVTTKSGLQY